MEEAHIEGKCPFEASMFKAPIEEQWVWDMATTKQRGLLYLESPGGKQLIFSVELDHFSSTMDGVPYFECELKGITQVDE